MNIINSVTGLNMNFNSGWNTGGNFNNQQNINIQGNYNFNGDDDDAEDDAQIDDLIRRPNRNGELEARGKGQSPEMQHQQIHVFLSDDEEKRQENEYVKTDFLKEKPEHG